MFARLSFHLKLREGLSPTTANRCLALTSSIFCRAIELGMATENPCRGISKAKESGARKRVLSGDELGRFMKALREEMDTPSGRAVFLLLATGLRKLEVLSWRWSNIDLENRRVFIPVNKANKPRYAPLNSQAVDLLRQMHLIRPEGIDWVFPSNSSTGHLLDVRRTFATVLEKAEIQALRIHDLRRSFASILINSGVSIYEIKDLLGHADIRTTQVYAHLGTHALQNATEAAAAELGKALAHV